ncbi:MAG TPA: molybdenum ABC transporter ATP-binding protein [Methylophilaceae bacterium]|jgi:molybdate transport system ATP-binding protein
MIDLDIRLNRGSFVLDAKLFTNEPVIGLFGPSGSGKSTILAILAGLIKPDEGRFVIDGECLFDSEKKVDVAIHHRRIGLVFQDSRLFPHLSARNNLDYGLNLLAPRNQRFSFDQIVALLEIGHLLERRPHQLSGGGKQRVALGRALLASPRLLLLDEPLASLDSRLKNQILPFLRRIKEQLQIPMIYVSHSINEILHLTQTLAIIQAGSIIANGGFHEVIKDERVLSLAHSLGLDNVIHAEVLEHNQEFEYTLTGYGENKILLPLLNKPIGSFTAISIPASNIALSKLRLSALTIQNQLHGTVTAIRKIDHRVLVSVDIGCVLIAEVTAKAVHDLEIKCGDSVYCLVKAQAIRHLGDSAD